MGESFKAINLCICYNDTSTKQYIYSLEEVSSFSHTADFNTKKMLEVLEKIGPEKFLLLFQMQNLQ